MSVATGGTFAYEAQTPEGQLLKGTLEAASTDDAQARLSSLQLRVLSISVAAADLPNAGRHVHLGVDDFLVFNQQLAHLTQAGMPVERGLRLIAIDLKSGRLARAAEEVAADLEKGMPLKDAFSRHASRFPPLYGRLIDAGAAAGSLPGMLFNLGKHMELTARLRHALWRTLAYPMMVLVALSLVLLMISLWVLPHFEALYADFKINPMFLTQAMMAMGNVYPVIFACVSLLLILLVAVDFALKAAGGAGLRWDGLFWYVPFIGKVLRVSLLARWIDALRLGIEAGLDLPRAIDLATQATAGRGQSLAIDAKMLSDIVSRGLPLSTFTGRVLPPTVPAAIELASKTTDLPSALYSLTRMYEQQAEHRLRLLPSILTPVLMVIVGVSIVLCIGALIGPLLQLISSVSGGDSF